MPVPPILRGGLSLGTSIPAPGTEVPPNIPSAWRLSLCPSRRSRGVAGAYYPLSVPLDPSSVDSPLEPRESEEEEESSSDELSPSSEGSSQDRLSMLGAKPSDWSSTLVFFRSRTVKSS